MSDYTQEQVDAVVKNENTGIQQATITYLTQRTVQLRLLLDEAHARVAELEAEPAQVESPT